MTRMSDSRCAAGARSSRKLATSLRTRGVVRHVQDSAAVLGITLLRLSLLGTGACVIPPQLSVGGDGGADSPPAIMSVIADQETLVAPGPVTFPVTQPGMPAGTATVSLLETDTSDTLYVRWFVDYQLSPIPRFDCPPAAPDGMSVRSTICDLETLCTELDLKNVNGETCEGGVPCHDLQIFVFNHQPDDGSGNPPYQDVAPGESTSVFYHLECEPS
jgi:hypothetical protein